MFSSIRETPSTQNSTIVLSNCGLKEWRKQSSQYYYCFECSITTSGEKSLRILSISINFYLSSRRGHMRHTNVYYENILIALFRAKHVSYLFILVIKAKILISNTFFVTLILPTEQDQDWCSKTFARKSGRLENLRSCTAIWGVKSQKIAMCIVSIAVSVEIGWDCTAIHEVHIGVLLRLYSYNRSLGVARRYFPPHQSRYMRS